MQKIINTKGGTTKPSVGRPKTETVKDHWISFRVTAAEHYQLMEKAQRSGMSAGEYARSRTMRGIARKKNKPKTVEAFGAQTRALLHELRKQGTNLNQIIHHCHRHQIPPPPAVVELAGSLKALWKQLSS